MVQLNLDGTVSLVGSIGATISRRQDVPEVYDMTTVCYAANPEFILRHGSLLTGRVRAVHVPKERSIDIDTPLDFQIAELLFSMREQKVDCHKKSN